MINIWKINYSADSISTAINALVDICTIKFDLFSSNIWNNFLLIAKKVNALGSFLNKEINQTKFKTLVDFEFLVPMLLKLPD